MVINKTCPTCHKSFASKSNYEFHINRKSPCVFSEQSAESLSVPKNFKCSRCECMFQTNQKLTLHMNRKKPCEIKQDAEQQFAVEQLQKDKDKLAHELELQKLLVEQLLLTRQSNVMNNSHSHNNTTNNTTNNIVNINMLGQEDMSHISNKQFRDCFKRHYQSIEALFHLKHFSDRKPENLNIFIEKIND